MTQIIYGTRGYVEELNFALRDQPTEFRYFGNIPAGSSSKMPKERVTPLMKQISSKFVASSIKYDDIHVEFAFEYQLVDGKELSYIDNAITSTDNQVAGVPDWKHTVEVVDPANAYSLPSRTIHIELYDELGAFVRALDVIGCLIKSIEIKHVIDDPDGVKVIETFIGQRITNNNPTSNLLGAVAGAVADPEGVQGDNYADSIAVAAPNSGSAASDSDSDGLSFVFRAGSGYATNPQPFKVSKASVNSINVGGTLQMDPATPATYGTVTSSGTPGDLKSYYKAFGIKVDFTYKESRPDRAGTNNFGSSISPYLMNALVQTASIVTTLQLDTDSAVLDMNLDKYKQDRTKSIFYKVEKFNDAGDWIAFCFAPHTSGAIQNVNFDFDGDFDFLSIQEFYTFSWACKDLVIVIGNDFSTLRAVS